MIVVAALCGYLLGTIPSAALVTRLMTRGAVDIHKEGSGNPGALNAYKVLGTWGGLVVLGLDVGKGVAAGFLGLAVAGDAGAYTAATAAIAGHIFPIWTRLRGGKGIATSAGACLAVFPGYFPINFVAALLSALHSRRVDLGTQVGCAVWITSAALWWVFDWPNLWGPPPGPGLVAFSVGGSALILAAFARARQDDRSVAGGSATPRSTS